MSEYKLIAFDMDGTLLNSKKVIDESSLEAIERAFDAGKEVVLSTGRGIAELRGFFEQIPRLRYAICVSGALVYDAHEKRAIYSNALQVDQVREILDASLKQDILVQMLTSRASVIQADKIEHTENYGMGVYKPMWKKVATTPEDIVAYYNADPIPVEKINLYHRNTDERIVTHEDLKAREKTKDLEFVYSEQTSLECSAPGVTKGLSLERLCKHLGLTLAETIGVGDANNDLEMLKFAGLAVAMGNALPAVKEICDVVVADNDHGGCAEAIDKYLL